MNFRREWAGCRREQHLGGKMLFTFDVVLGAPGEYFGVGHKVLLLIGLIAVVGVLVAWRIVFVLRRARRGRR
jgi:hypothetical protein